mgnify:CR=1 FL=1
MKKSVGLLSLILLMGMSISCGAKESDKGSESTDVTSEKVTPDSVSVSAESTASIAAPSTYGMVLVVGTEEKTSCEKNFDLNSSHEDVVRLKVSKDGKEVDGEDIRYHLGGNKDAADIELFVSSHHNYARIKFKAVGTVTITFTLAEHGEVDPVSVTYHVTQGFLNQNIIRGDIREENGVISIPGNVQATALSYKEDTKWALSATMKVPLYSSGESFGIGSFLDEGNSAFWSALRNKNKTKDGKYEIYLRDFFTGWGTPIYDKEACPEYQELDFPVENGKSVVRLRLIRNGLYYYLDINGYHYQYESKETRATYPGFFSQNQSAEITDYHVSYEQQDIEEEIQKEWNDNAKLDILRFAQKDSTSLKAGESRNFQLVKAPEYAKEQYFFQVNETFRDYVTVEDHTIKLDSYAPEGILEVTVSSQSGKLSDCYTIPVTKGDQITENENLVATGGAYLSGSHNLVFPEALYENDGIGDETKYDDSPLYGAKLKQQVYGSSFTLDFDVRNYDGHGKDDNKLLVSLGGRFNQYYFSFGNGTASVKAYTQSEKQNKTNEGSYLSADPIIGLDEKDHHIRIHSEEGAIEITVDGKKAHFPDGAPWMNLSSFFMELPVRIATKNASCEVSGIAVEKGTLSDADIYSHNSDYVHREGKKYVITMQTKNGWDYRDKLNLNACTFKEFGKCSGAYTAKFKATLEGAKSASKFCIRIGDVQEHEAQICFGENKIENGNFQNSSSISIAQNDTVYITMYRRLDGTANIGVAKNENDAPTYIAKEFHDVSDNGVWFWARNSKDETTKKIAIENIEVTVL